MTCEAAALLFQSHVNYGTWSKDFALYPTLKAKVPLCNKKMIQRKYNNEKMIMKYYYYQHSGKTLVCRQGPSLKEDKKYTYVYVLGLMMSFPRGFGAV